MPNSTRNNTSRSRNNSGRRGQTQKRQQPKSDPPWAEYRSGKLKATVWENNSDGGTFFSTVLVRIYQDDDGNWHESSSLNRDDLLRAANLLKRAFDAIEEEEQARRDESREAA